MYKIIIADDDVKFLEQFKKITDWERFEMSVAASFDNAEDVLEYVKNNIVDAIITDIAMPDMTGLDIAKYIYDNYPNVKVMLFSAFQSFKYAHEALEYGVVGYMTKPIYFEKLYKNLEKLKQILDSKKNDGFLSDEMIVGRSEFVKEYFCMDNAYKSIVRNMLDKINLPYNILYMQSAVVTFEIRNADYYMENVWKHGGTALNETIKRITCYGNDSFYCIPLYVAENDITVLIITKKQNGHFEQYIDEIKNKMSETISMDIEQTEKQFAGSLADMRRLIKDRQSEYLAAVGKNLKSLSNEEETFKEKLQKYIEENCLRDISRSDAAKEFFMNESAFSRLFKDEFGESFIDYVSHIRMEKIKQKIIDNDDSITELYEECGYKSKSQFFRVFRQYTGMTPLEYRKRHMTETQTD